MGRGRGETHGSEDPPLRGREERSLHCAGRPFRRSETGRKSWPAPVGMTGRGWVGAFAARLKPCPDENGASGGGGKGAAVLCPYKGKKWGGRFGIGPFCEGGDGGKVESRNWKVEKAESRAKRREVPVRLRSGQALHYELPKIASSPVGMTLLR